MNTPDTSPETVERYTLYDWGWRETDEGDWVSYGDYAALSTQLASVTTERDTARSHREALIIMADKAHAAGKAEGLREAVDKIRWKYNTAETDDNGTVSLVWACEEVRALITADTPAAKVTVTVQEAARVLLGDDYDSPMLETLDAYNNDYDVGQDVLKALRAIAGDKT
jgi:hypothetical protein